MPATNHQPIEPTNPEYNLFERGILAVDDGLGVTEDDAVGVIAVGVGVGAGMLTFYGVSHLGLDSVNDVANRVTRLEAEIAEMNNQPAPEVTELSSSDFVLSGIAAVAVTGLVAVSIIRGVKHKALSIRQRS